MLGTSTRVVLVVASMLVLSWPAIPAGAGGGGCHEESTEGTGDTVHMAAACFTPSVLRVEPGTEVTFVNKDMAVHNVTSPTFYSEGDLREGDAFRAVFEEEGTYPYACMYHFGMTGAVVVGDGTGSGGSVKAGKTADLAELADKEPVARSQAPAETSSATGYAIAGGIGLLAGAGFGALRRRRTI